MFDTLDNPFPVLGTTPTKNVQAGYASRPALEIPDDLSNTPPVLQPFYMPKLTKFRSRAIFADPTAARTRVITRHRSGINTLFGDGSARWIDLQQFDQPEALWPEPTFPPTSNYNVTQDSIWSSLDR